MASGIKYGINKSQLDRLGCLHCEAPPWKRVLCEYTETRKNDRSKLTHIYYPLFHSTSYDVYDDKTKEQLWRRSFVLSGKYTVRSITYLAYHLSLIPLIRKITAVFNSRYATAQSQWEEVFRLLVKEISDVAVTALCGLGLIFGNLANGAFGWTCMDWQYEIRVYFGKLETVAPNALGKYCHPLDIPDTIKTKELLPQLAKRQIESQKGHYVSKAYLDRLKKEEDEIACWLKGCSTQTQTRKCEKSLETLDCQKQRYSTLLAQHRQWLGNDAATEYYQKRLNRVEELYRDIVAQAPSRKKKSVSTQNTKSSTLKRKRALKRH
ncbi:MAG: hypothetical protein H7A37_06230 [Chlamydiales bacterium]|nr:hypothetical protein [Chlamydiales bacterium]